MFPLVPDLISEELNLIVALLIGIAFGFILEQAGFSSSRKLAGVFYGYDFTVLRVFFTAGVTAMSGVAILGYLGWLDTDFIYINPTYLEAAILGGVIMGFGFIIGGFCPGTSVCGAAIGKIDAMFFVGGGLIGVFLYAELYPWFEGITNASFLGNIRIFNTFGISQGLFALMLIAVAVGAFMITTTIEKKINAHGPATLFNKMHHRLAGAAVLLIGVVLLFLPDHKQRLLGEVTTDEYVNSHPVKEMTSDELAFRVIDRDPRLQVIDIRNASDFAQMALPGAVNIQIEQLLKKEFSNILGRKHTKKVFIANDEIDARKAALLAERLGYDNITVLCGGLPEFVNTIIHQQPAMEKKICSFQFRFAGTNPPEKASSPMDISTTKDTDRFRAKASGVMMEMIKEAKNSAAKPAKLVKKVAGGC